VIDGAEEMKVDVSDRPTFSAKLAGSDAPSDLAVLKTSAGDLSAHGREYRYRLRHPLQHGEECVGQLIGQRKVHRGYQGVGIQPVTSDRDDTRHRRCTGRSGQLGDSQRSAQRAGIRASDVFTAFDGTPVDDPILFAIASQPPRPESAVNLTIVRDGGSAR
jgi:S1-C subfamily serine protease